MTRPDPKFPRPSIRALLLGAIVLMSSGGCYWLFPDHGKSGLDGYPGQDPAATASYVKALDFSVTDSIFSGPLECESAAACGNSSTVNIRIVPEKRAFRAPIDAALSRGAGFIVARIENLENKPFAPYGLAANDVAYLWVGTLESGDRRIAIVRIDRETGASRLLATALQAGYCPGSNEGRKISAVHINANPMCTERSFYAAPARTASVARLASATPGHDMAAAAMSSAFSHARGLWFSCSMGCCEARAFQF